MIPDVTRWGTRFAGIPSPKRTCGDYYKFVSCGENTVVTISGGFTDTFTLIHPGDFTLRLIPSNAHVLITSTQPIMVVQITMSQMLSNELSDPSMMYLPPVNLYSNGFSFATMTYAGLTPGIDYEHVLKLIIRNQDVSGLLIDEVPPSNVNWQPIANSEYVGASIIVGVSLILKKLEHFRYF